ncbi:amidase [Deinococcus ruber]|uniref:Amidase n=1 Tax=Deinococcus ruber TaxID=1848197 RepID=A0A918CEY5_9DEIO|nr:amidase [Deinococcus ruber]GGR19453.1 amidase [Deinococcus ruber]
MNDADLLFVGVAQLGALYRSGQLSPVEVTRRCLERIEALDPALNAFITVTAEQALRQAALAEQELRAGHDRGPLHGVPIALKDLIDTAGIRTTCASRILHGHIPQRDAVIVRHLNAAGAVSLGKTNCSEFAMGVPHPDYGQSNNPWDPARTSGASSGGSAAAVAAGLCFAAVGTDTGGSIRIPASYCGLAGLKPTYGLVDVQGVFPLSWSLDHAGPLARSSADAALLLGAMTGQPFQQEVSLNGKRFGIIQRSGPGMQPEVTAVFDAACDTLRAAGAEVVSTEVPGLEQVDAALLAVLLPEAAAIHAQWIGSRADEYADITRQQIEMGFAVPAVTHVRAQQFRRWLTRQFLEAFRSVDALISPAVAWVAPKEDPAFTGGDGAVEGTRSSPHNLTGLPALSVNAGFGEGGLPVGLQIVTRPHTDALCLGLGSAMETAFALQKARPAIGS